METKKDESRREGQRNRDGGPTFFGGLASLCQSPVKSGEMGEERRREKYLGWYEPAERDDDGGVTEANKWGKWRLYIMPHTHRFHMQWKTNPQLMCRTITHLFKPPLVDLFLKYLVTFRTNIPNNYPQEQSVSPVATTPHSASAQSTVAAPVGRLYMHSGVFVLR